MYLRSLCALSPLHVTKHSGRLECQSFLFALSHGSGSTGGTSLTLAWADPVRLPSWGCNHSENETGRWGLRKVHPNIWRVDTQMSHFPGAQCLMLPTSTKFTLKIDCAIIFKNSQTWWSMLAFPWGEIRQLGVTTGWQDQIGRREATERGIHLHTHTFLFL
jgi:hypothetical protein